MLLLVGVTPDTAVMAGEALISYVLLPPSSKCVFSNRVPNIMLPCMRETRLRDGWGWKGCGDISRLTPRQDVPAPQNGWGFPCTAGGSDLPPPETSGSRGDDGAHPDPARPSRCFPLLPRQEGPARHCGERLPHGVLSVSEGVPALSVKGWGP